MTGKGIFRRGFAANLPVAASVAAYEGVLGVLAINLQSLLIGASLEPVFRGPSLWHKATRMHWVADENWAVAMAAWRRCGMVSTAYLLGGGLCVLSAWCLGTLSGHILGAAVHDPVVYAPDFAFVAVFTALAVSLWRGLGDAVPWLVSAGAAVLVEKLLPGKWYILGGALAGSFIAALAIYALRLGGLLLSRRLPRGGRFRTFLDALPWNF